MPILLYNYYILYYLFNIKLLKNYKIKVLKDQNFNPSSKRGRPEVFKAESIKRQMKC